MNNLSAFYARSSLIVFLGTGYSSIKSQELGSLPEKASKPCAFTVRTGSKRLQSPLLINVVHHDPSRIAPDSADEGENSPWSTPSCSATSPASVSGVCAQEDLKTKGPVGEIPLLAQLLRTKSDGAPDGSGRKRADSEITGGSSVNGSPETTSRKLGSPLGSGANPSPKNIITLHQKEEFPIENTAVEITIQPFNSQASKD